MAKKITVIPARENLANLTEQLNPLRKRVAAYCRVSTDYNGPLVKTTS